MSYSLPGTIIEEVTSPGSVNPSSTQRTPCFIGTASARILVKGEEVIRSSTGLSDELEYTADGIYSIELCGSQKGLNDFEEGVDFDLTGDHIIWTSSGIIDPLSTYFVTYYYDRPATDYKFKTFYRYEDVTADLGPDAELNNSGTVVMSPLVMIAKLAFRVYNIPAICTVQVPATETSNDYLDALNLCKFRDIQTPIAMTTNAAVQAYIIAHVNERSLAVNGRYRTSYMGAPAETSLGTDDNPATLRGMAVGILNERISFMNATRAKYYYNHPTTKEELYTTVNGSFIAAAVAAYRDSFGYPATTLLGKTIPGLELYEEDYDDYYAEDMLKLAGSSSLFLLAPASGGMKVIDDLTTDNSTIERNNINIITAKDYVAKDVALQIDRTFKGSLIKNRSFYVGVVDDYLNKLFKSYVTDNIIESIGTISVSAPTDKRDTIRFKYSYYAVYTHKYTEGEYSIEL
jgi:hypothetical protein